MKTWDVTGDGRPRSVKLDGRDWSYWVPIHLFVISAAEIGFVGRSELLPLSMLRGPIRIFRVTSVKLGSLQSALTCHR